MSGPQCRGTPSPSPAPARPPTNSSPHWPPGWNACTPRVFTRCGCSALAARTHVPGRAPTRVLLRINPAVPDGTLAGSALTMGGRPTPFGMGAEEASEALRLLAGDDCPGLEPAGVHAHLASGLPAGALLRVAEAIVVAAAELSRRHRTALPEVGVGGGMAVDYTRPGDRFDWTAYGTGLDALARRHPGLRLRVEPGRALTAYCGWYVTEVLDVKRSHGEDVAVVRGGTHHLRTPAAKGHDQPAEVVPVESWPHPWPRPAAADGRVTVTGQLCTPKDVLARGLAAPGLRAGTVWSSPWPAPTPGTSPTVTS